MWVYPPTEPLHRSNCNRPASSDACKLAAEAVDPCPNWAIVLQIPRHWVPIHPLPQNRFASRCSRRQAARARLLQKNGTDRYWWSCLKVMSWPGRICMLPKTSQERCMKLALPAVRLLEGDSIVSNARFLILLELYGRPPLRER